MDIAALADLLHETSEHHGVFEAAAPPHDWWDWYAAYMDARGAEGPRTKHPPPPGATWPRSSTSSGPLPEPLTQPNRRPRPPWTPSRTSPHSSLGLPCGSSADGQRPAPSTSTTSAPASSSGLTDSGRRTTLSSVGRRAWPEPGRIRRLPSSPPFARPTPRARASHAFQPPPGGALLMLAPLPHSTAPRRRSAATSVRRRRAGA